MTSLKKFKPQRSLLAIPTSSSHCDLHTCTSSFRLNNIFACVTANIRTIQIYENARISRESHEVLRGGDACCCYVWLEVPKSSHIASLPFFLQYCCWLEWVKSLLERGQAFPESCYQSGKDKQNINENAPAYGVEQWFAQNGCPDGSSQASEEASFCSDAHRLRMW